MPRAKYGSQKKIDDAKRALPDVPEQTAPAAVDPQRVMSAAQSFAPPQIGLGAPTSRPNEPVTMGMGDPVAAPIAPPNPDVIAMAQHLPMLEALAARPNASASTRAFVRRLRSMLPPDFDFNA